MPLPKPSPNTPTPPNTPPNTPLCHTAMVMAAGLGTRMRPLTNDRPKALVSVGGRVLLDHIVSRLQDAGVQHAVVNIHHFADAMQAHIADRTRTDTPKITISDEREQLLETGGALVKARSLLGDDPIFVANADPVWVEDAGSVPALAALKAAWDGDKMDALLLLARMERTMGFDGPGDFTMDDAGRLTRRGQAPSAPFAYAGVQIFKPQLADGFPLEPFSLNAMWNPALAAGRVFGCVLDGEWMHVGDPAARDEAEARLAALGALA